jgi:hypothetical protein
MTLNSPLPSKAGHKALFLLRILNAILLDFIFFGMKRASKQSLAGYHLISIPVSLDDGYFLRSLGDGIANHSTHFESLLLRPVAD